MQNCFATGPSSVEVKAGSNQRTQTDNIPPVGRNVCRRLNSTRALQAGAQPQQRLDRMHLPSACSQEKRGAGFRVQGTDARTVVGQPVAEAGVVPVGPTYRGVTQQAPQGLVYLRTV